MYTYICIYIIYIILYMYPYICITGMMTQVFWDLCVFRCGHRMDLDIYITWMLALPFWIWIYITWMLTHVFLDLSPRGLDLFDTVRTWNPYLVRWRSMEPLMTFANRTRNRLTNDVSSSVIQDRQICLGYHNPTDLAFFSFGKSFWRVSGEVSLIKCTRI